MAPHGYNRNNSPKVRSGSAVLIISGFHFNATCRRAALEKMVWGVLSSGLQEVFTRYGKCYMFNAEEEGKTLRTTMKGGTGNGLEIMLDIQQDEYLPVWGDTEDTTFEAGVRVQIHSQAEPPFVHELGFGVAPGFQTFVATQEQRITYLPPPWGECESKALESGFFQVYSVTACRIDCETRYIVENCNCRMVHMPGDASYCTPEQYKDCAEPALGNETRRDNVLSYLDVTPDLPICVQPTGALYQKKDAWL
ncbi:hypothetical protein JOQ06_010038 [Pogonophryne albipinna]|uniref:Acid-sensing ion channel 2 n=1 Tax=Pogonophryne albipinna TaxID=1090488 RepID=A0AAD6AV50_9TELE|nr:hypothetical protein JOQ06_010038 [Pogonophryne albipinna]